MNHDNSDPVPGGLSDAVIASRVRSRALSTGIAAVLLLLFGFGLGLRGISGDSLYDGSVAAFTLTLQIGGAALGAATVACLLGTVWGMLLDGAASLAIGAVFFVVGIIWLVNGDAIQGVLVMIFGVMFGAAGRTSYMDFSSMRRSRAAAGPEAETEAADTASSEISSENQSVLALAKSKGKAADEQPVSAEAGVEQGGTAEPPGEPPSREDASEDAEEPPPAANADGPPPEGFLASFADESKKKKPS